MAKVFAERVIVPSRNNESEVGDHETETGMGFTAPELCAAYKAAYENFVSGKTNRKSFEAISQHLAGALQARRQMVNERDRLTSMRGPLSYFN